MNHYHPVCGAMWYMSGCLQEQLRQTEQHQTKKYQYTVPSSTEFSPCSVSSEVACRCIPLQSGEYIYPQHQRHSVWWSTLVSIHLNDQQKGSRNLFGHTSVGCNDAPALARSTTKLRRLWPSSAHSIIAVWPNTLSL